MYRVQWYSIMSSVTWIVLYALVTITLVTHVRTDKVKKSETVAELYEKGVEAYLEERFPQCVENLEHALQQYRSQRRNLQNCRLKCRHESDASEPLFPVDIEDLRFYEKTVRNTLCIVNCRIKNVGNDGNMYVGSDLQAVFEERKPYEYLHLCYYKINDKQNAASAAFTFLVANPDHKVMAKNLKQYSELPEVNMKEVVNFEGKDYIYLYVYGADAYEKKDWDAAINNMEESLVSYLQAEDECRAQCEGPFDPGWYPDFIPAISNHFTYVLKCKRNCKKKLGSLNGEVHEDLLASHYHYLQFAYFKKGNLLAACQAVASYLMFLPDDETMLANMRYYQSLPKVQDAYFTPREEAVRYAQRDMYEQRILHFIRNEFAFENKLIKNKVTENFKTSPCITKNGTQLGGNTRFSSDGLSSTADCEDLMYIANNFANMNDGYTSGNVAIKNKSPHTKNELFKGVTLSRITFLVYIRVLKPRYLKLTLELTENLRKKVIEAFNIKDELYFSYTHLACRSALPDSPQNRIDLSHMIHADNCNLLADDICEKKDPAFFWRDYSAILYLNENFNGGEFMFSSDLKGHKIQSYIKPECGRMVAFSSGHENLHGVKAVKNGTRCALAIWFTFDPKYQEVNRELAYHMLENNVTFDRYSSIDIEELIKNDL